MEPVVVPAHPLSDPPAPAGRRLGIHNKPDYTVGGVSKPWRLTTYNCQTGAVVATTYHSTKSAAQSEASNHVGDEYDTYKPVDCEISSWSSWGDYTTCVDNKQTQHAPERSPPRPERR